MLQTQKNDLDNVEKTILTEHEKIKTIDLVYEQWKIADPVSKKVLIKELSDLLNSTELQNAYLKSE